VIAEKGRRMNQLIDDLLEFSRAGKKRLEVSNVDMTSLVNVICEELHETLQHSAKVVVHNLESAVGDAMLLRQVLINLISNAIKYSSKVEKPVVEISSVINDSKVVYSIKDNGAGFDMQYADKLFGVFQRLHKDNEFSGTGIGLSIVQRIVARHGGAVWAESAIDKGATFHFSLPLTPTE
jgi:light-regulated signal transduction histidine kinase (bacteriophytochrome)